MILADFDTEEADFVSPRFGIAQLQVVRRSQD